MNVPQEDPPIYAGVFGCEVASNILGCHLVKERSELHHIENVFGDSPRLGTGVDFFYDLQTQGNDSRPDHFDFSCGAFGKINVAPAHKRTAIIDP